VHQAPRLVSVGGGRGHRGGAQAQARQTDADPDADAVAEGQAHPMPEPALVPVPEPEPEPVDELSPLATFAGLEDVTALLRERRELRLLEAVEQRLRLVAFRPGVIEVSPTPGAESDLCNKLSETLRRLTGHRWSVAVSDAPGQPTLAAQRAEADAARRAQAANHPLVRAVLGVFPGAEIRDVRPLRGPSATPAPLDYLPAIPERDEVDGDLVDGDDPFEEM
jgi:DNA polymerase-3 subunit gamma/tau